MAAAWAERPRRPGRRLLAHRVPLERRRRPDGRHAHRAGAARQLRPRRPSRPVDPEVGAAEVGEVGRRRATRRAGWSFVITLTDDGDALDRRGRRRRLRQRLRQADRPGGDAGADAVALAARSGPVRRRGDDAPGDGRPAAAARLRLAQSAAARRCSAAAMRSGSCSTPPPRSTFRQAPKNAVQFASMQSFGGAGYSAVRIATRAPVAFDASADRLGLGDHAGAVQHARHSRR